MGWRISRQVTHACCHVSTACSRFPTRTSHFGNGPVRPEPGHTVETWRHAVETWWPPLVPRCRAVRRHRTAGRRGRSGWHSGLVHSHTGAVKHLVDTGVLTRLPNSEVRAAERHWWSRVGLAGARCRICARPGGPLAPRSSRRPPSERVRFRTRRGTPNQGRSGDRGRQGGRGRCHSRW